MEDITEIFVRELDVWAKEAENDVEAAKCVKYPEDEDLFSLIYANEIGHPLVDPGLGSQDVVLGTDMLVDGFHGQGFVLPDKNMPSVQALGAMYRLMTLNASMLAQNSYPRHTIFASKYTHFAPDTDEVINPFMKAFLCLNATFLAAAYTMSQTTKVNTSEDIAIVLDEMLFGGTEGLKLTAEDLSGHIKLCNMHASPVLDKLRSTQARIKKILASEDKSIPEGFTHIDPGFEGSLEDELCLAAEIENKILFMQNLATLLFHLLECKVSKAEQSLKKLEELAPKLFTEEGRRLAIEPENSYDPDCFRRMGTNNTVRKVNFLDEKGSAEFFQTFITDMKDAFTINALPNKSVITMLFFFESYMDHDRHPFGRMALWHFINHSDRVWSIPFEKLISASFTDFPIPEQVRKHALTENFVRIIFNPWKYTFLALLSKLCRQHRHIPDRAIAHWEDAQELAGQIDELVAEQLPSHDPNRGMYFFAQYVIYVRNRLISRCLRGGLGLGLYAEEEYVSIFLLLDYIHSNMHFQYKTVREQAIAFEDFYFQKAVAPKPQPAAQKGKGKGKKSAAPAKTAPQARKSVMHENEDFTFAVLNDAIMWMSIYGATVSRIVTLSREGLLRKYSEEKMWANYMERFGWMRDCGVPPFFDKERFLDWMEKSDNGTAQNLDVANKVYDQFLHNRFRPSAKDARQKVVFPEAQTDRLKRVAVMNILDMKRNVLPVAEDGPKYKVSFSFDQHPHVPVITLSKQ